MMTKAIERFNEASAELQKTEFRRPKTPAEWQQRANSPALRDYAKLFKAVVPILEAFEATPPNQRTGIGSKLNSDALGILRTFASSMSILAVRQNSPVLLAQGLIALAILGDIDDIRDLGFYLAAIYHSATKLAIDTRKLFGEIAELATSTYFQELIRDFPLRQPKARDLSAFGFREVQTDEGYDLEQDRRW